jgi:hypothetical protein
LSSYWDEMPRTLGRVVLRTSGNYRKRPLARPTKPRANDQAKAGCAIIPLLPALAPAEVVADEDPADVV